MTGVAIEATALPTGVAYQSSYWVELKDGWKSGDWEIDPTLAPIGRSTWCMFHDDDAQMTLERKLGSAKEPWETAFSTRTPQFYFGKPVRVRMLEYGAEVPVTVFQGQIEVASMTLGGDSSIGQRQIFSCIGPRTILDRVRWHDAQFGALPTDWHPAFNRTVSGSSSLRGNWAGGNSFGGSLAWNMQSVFEYALHKAGSANGPRWDITYSSDFGNLQDIPANIGERDVWTAVELIKLSLPSAYGYDIAFEPRDSGFAVRVVNYGNQSAPFYVDPDDDDIIRVDMEFSSNRQFDKITVIGERTTLCETAENLYPSWRAWTDAQQDAYRAPLTANAANTNLTRTKADSAREAPEHGDVYASFVKPTGVYMTIDDDAGEAQATVRTGWQTEERTTHRWVPFFAGVDYSQNPPAGLSSVERNNIMQPFALVYNEIRGAYETPENENVTLQINALKHDCGLRVASNPQHVMAKGRWTKSELDANEPGYSWTATGTRGADRTDTNPRFDYSRTVFTFAYPTDGRLKVSAELADGAKKNDASHLVEYVRDAQAWVIAPNTVLSADGAEDFIRSPEEFMVVRNDSDVLRYRLQQLQERYFYPRMAAVVHYSTMRWLGDAIGRGMQIDNDIARMFRMPWISKAVIDWDRGETKLLGGYAR